MRLNIILLLLALLLVQHCAGRITPDQFKCLFTNLRTSPNVNQYVDAINEASTRYGITMPRRLPLFITLSGYMSNFYERFVLSDNTICRFAVEGGCTFRGRGAFMVMGKSAYQQLSKHFGVDFVAAPQRLSELPYAILSAGWLWHDLGLNGVADVENLQTLTRRLGIIQTTSLVEFWGRALNCMRQYPTMSRVHERSYCMYL